MKAAFREWRRGRRAEVAENTFMDWYMGELERENEELRQRLASAQEKAQHLDSSIFEFLIGEGRAKD